MQLDKESQRLVLPKNIFKSESRWLFYEAWTCTSCVLSGFWVALGVAAVKASTDSCCSIIFEVTLCCLALILNSVLACNAHLKKHCKYSSKLVQQVLELNPGFDIEKWDLISSKLNNRFYQNNMWRTPYFFFDGNDALHSFRENILKSYLNDELDGITNAYEIESARNYLQSVDEKFEFYLKETLRELSPESSLIKEPRGNRSVCIFKKYLVVPLTYAWQVHALQAAIILGQIAAIMDLIGMFLSKSLSPGIFLFILHQCMSLSFRYVGSFRCTLMNIIDAIKFSAMITRVKPGNSLDKWDEIARYIKEYLINEQRSNTNIKFSDGKHCMEFYKTYLQPLSSEKRQCAYYELKGVLEIALQHLD